MVIFPIRMTISYKTECFAFSSDLYIVQISITCVVPLRLVLHIKCWKLRRLKKLVFYLREDNSSLWVLLEHLLLLCDLKYSCYLVF